MTEPGDDHARPAIRIGTAERNDALKALDAHLEAGRLDAVEYGDRSAHVAEARTADEIRPLFADLPAPHPRLPGDAHVPAAVGTETPAEAAATSPDRPARGGLATWGPRVAAVFPLIVVALVVGVSGHLWWLFLLVPVVGMLLGRSRDDGHRDRHDERHGHRDRHDERHGHRDRRSERRDDERD